MKEHQYVPISWSYASRPDSIDSLRHYLNRHADFIRDLNQQDTPCFYLAGIHPRCISPDLRPHHLADLLTSYLDDPLCLGFGEIGLETGSSLEQEILSAHLELFHTVKDAKKRLGIHTPRSNKQEMTEKILSLLAAFSGIEPITVIDHCTIDTISPVLASGFHAGVTLSPTKTSHEDMMIIIKNHHQDLNRIMFNTDSGGTLYQDLYTFSSSDAFLPDVRNQLVRQTATRFFLMRNEE